MMNTIISKVGLILLATSVIGGCAKDASLSETSAADGLQSKAKTYHIYYATWEEWGHVDGNGDCVGRGLCRFEDCLFCCTENDLIVDCSSLEEIPNAGEALIDKETDLGVMTISLDSSNPEHVSAINNRSDLIITDDLNDGELKLLKGNYPYISTIGIDGGYEVNAERVP